MADRGVWISGAVGAEGDLPRWRASASLRVLVLVQVDTHRHVSPTERHPHITDALQGADEGRALGLPNPGSSVFHVLLLPTMLSRISRWSLSVNLKPVCYAKGIRPGWQ